MTSGNDKAAKMNLLLHVWRRWLVIIFFIFLYHFIRDILQDIFNIHNVFTEFMHYVPDESKVPIVFGWITFGGYGKWVTFPIELFLLFKIPSLLKEKTFVFYDIVIFSVLSFIEIIWALNYYYS